MVLIMGTKLHLFIILTTVFKCNGHVPILGDILSGAHNVLGGLAHGLNVNFGGQFELKGKPPPPPEPEKTVIVVVQEENNGNDRVPNDPRPSYNTGDGHGSYGDRPYQQGIPNQFGYTHHGHPHNINRPYGHEGPQNNYNNYHGDGNYGNQEYHPHHGHKYPNHQNNFNRPYNHIPGNNNEYNNHNQGNNNYDNGGEPNEGNYYGNKPIRPNQGNNNFNGFTAPNEGWANQPNGNQGSNNFNGFTTPNEGWSNQPSGNQGNNNFNGFTASNEGWSNQPSGNQGNNNFNGFTAPNEGGSNQPSGNQGNNNYNGLTTPQQSFTSDFATRDPITTNKPNKVTQKKPHEDAPLFIPLNLTETDSGKTNTDPKREVENKDEEFDIDVRIKNE